MDLRSYTENILRVGLTEFASLILCGSVLNIWVLQYLNHKILGNYNRLKIQFQFNKNLIIIQSIILRNPVSRKLFCLFHLIPKQHHFKGGPEWWWLHRDISDLKLVAIFGCWRQNFVLVDIFWMLVSETIFFLKK